MLPKVLLILFLLRPFSALAGTASAREARPTPAPTPRAAKARPGAATPAAPKATSRTKLRPPPPARSRAFLPEPAVPSVRILSTDQIALRVPAGRISFDPPRTGREVPGPIVGIRGPDGLWRGGGWIEGSTPVSEIDGSIEGEEYVVTYAFANGGRAEVRFRVPASGDHVQVTEECSATTSTWVLSFGENFVADTVLAKPTEADGWTGIRHVRPFGRLRQGRLVLWSGFGDILDFNDWMGVFGGRASRDFVGFLRIHSDRWTRPALNYLALWERDRELRLEGNWQAGRREWLLVVTSRRRDDAADARARLLELERQWVWNRDRWVLEWNEPITQYRPDLTESERRDKELVLAELDRLETLLDARGYLTLPEARPFIPVYQTYARLHQLGVLRPDEDRRARHALAALAYTCFSRDVFPWDRALAPPDGPDTLEPLFRGLAGANLNAERAAIVGELGAILARHPLARVWTDHAAEQFRLLMKSYVYPEGFWEEGFAGACEALRFLTPMARRLARAGNELLADPRFRSMWDFFIQTATPRDVEQGGWRSFPPFGETPARNDVRDLMLLGAVAFGDRDPLFARRLLWLHREMGGTAKEDPGRLLNALGVGRWAQGGEGVVLGLPADLTSAPQTLSSVNRPGFGAVLRAREPTGDETCLVLRNGQGWGRSHHDEGSIQLWAKGVALVTEAGRGGPGEWQTAARGHSRVACSEFEPAEALDGALHGYARNHRGQIRSFLSLSGADYLLGVTPILGAVKADPQSPYSRQPGVQYFDSPVIQRRHVLFLKPDYFILRDEVEGAAASDLWFHVNADGVTTESTRSKLLHALTGGGLWGGEQAPAVTFENRRGVNLDLFFLAPAKPQLSLGEVRTTEGLTRRVMLAGPENGGEYRTVLFPRRKTEPEPRVHAAGQGVVEIEYRGHRDVAILDGAVRTYRSRTRGVSLEASIGLVRQQGSAWTAVLIAGRSITLPGLTIRPSVPVSMIRDRYGAMSFETFEHGKPALIQLEGGWLRRTRLRLENKQTQPITDQNVVVTLPAGVNRFTIE